MFLVMLLYGGVVGFLFVMFMYVLGGNLENVLVGYLGMVFMVSYMFFLFVFSNFLGSCWCFIVGGVMIWILVSSVFGLVMIFGVLFFICCFVGIGDVVYGFLVLSMFLDYYLVV